ncbi:MAG: TonB-dependent receptor [Candidatus Pseudobacter hemicellulosilyticus]|uniref:TonB-dependent receptor n=1 Tax=Candidatus Pseudobacter hemicellulosilyticus TaxID=3121375 RepID=A0AAJ5WTH9_9BACT|nr:MAG: TonB-dependent receptor [Pseudobacter sp.]
MFKYLMLLLLTGAAFSDMQAQQAAVQGLTVPLASVLLTSQQDSFSVHADTSGRFRIVNIPAGHYNLRITCIGYLPFQSGMVLREQEQKKIDCPLLANEASLESITVTHSRFQKTDDLIDIRKVAQPTTIITEKAIRMMGSRRLDEVLREQTGMTIVNDLGAGNRSVGLQMQGFSSDYILILIDGQPMTGRFSGNFDLSRISIANIERIEVIKGASSSLYGSEALGGVVNIITKQVFSNPELNADLTGGTYNTLDASVSGATPFNKQRGAAWISGNYYSTDGFNVNTEYLKEGKTSPPYHSTQVQGKLRYALTDSSGLQVSSRFTNRQSTMQRSYGAQPFADRLDEQDLNTALTYNHSLRNGWRLLGRYYLTHYETEQAVTVESTGKLLQEHVFNQTIHRLELQGARDLWRKKGSITGGFGGDMQLMRNQSANSNEDMHNYFGYAQLNYSPAADWKLVAGARYDGNSTYGGRLNFSGGFTWTPLRWATLKGSVGNGFKAPTFAQLYQVFTNITQGYTVIGANDFQQKAAEMKEAGLVQQLWSNAAGIHQLKPETSTSYNAGLILTPGSRTEISVNAYYNEIRNLINTEQVGIMRNGQQLFSYLNIARSFTCGLETSIQYRPVKGLLISGGYQLLTAKSRAVIDGIKAGQSPYNTVRSPDGIRAASTSDYFGLPNRSKHMANLQAFYEYKPWGLGLSVRGNYRGKFGFMDMDNNGYIDQYDVFVEDYILLNAAIQKSLLRHQQLTLRLAVDNITHFTNYLLPSQPGRMILAGVSWHWDHRN